MKNNKKGFFNCRLFTFLLAGFMIITAQASIPVWTFTPLTATTVAVLANSTANVQYRVTNQSRKTHTLRLQPMQAVTQITTGLGICSTPFILTSKSSCILSIQINGSQLITPLSDGPVVCEQGSPLECYRPSASDVLRTIPVPINISPTSGTASGGTSFSITGTGVSTTTAVTFDGLPATNINVLNPTEVVGVTPAHTVGTVDVVLYTAEGAITLTNAYTYLTPAVGQPADGGKIACLGGGLQNLIAATTNISTSVRWGGNGIITNAQSITDGAANTATIVTVLGAGSYAAQLCNNYEVDSQGNTPCQAGNACYTDWFLPARTQLNCLYINKMALGNFGGGNDNYWTSSESTGVPATGAFYQYFVLGNQLVASKLDLNVVRCVRPYSP